MNLATLAARLGYKCSTKDGAISRWEDARPQPDWNALRPVEEIKLQAEKEEARKLKALADSKLRQSPEGLAIVAEKQAAVDAAMKP